jgi:hypothetical protein
MKRWILVSCLLLILPLGVLIPAGAQASTAAAGKLTSGKPVKVTISKSGQEPKYTFAGSANKNATFDVTHFNMTASGGNIPGFSLLFYKPGSSNPYKSCNFDRNNYCSFTTPVRGTWSITVSPFVDSVGSFTLTFANEVPTRALSRGIPVNTTIKFEGQEAGYTFTTTASTKVTFKVTNFNMTANGGNIPGFSLNFYEPSSSSPYTSCNFDHNSTCAFNTPVRGTWSITVIPFVYSVGSFTIKLT